MWGEAFREDTQTIVELPVGGLLGGEQDLAPRPRRPSEAVLLIASIAVDLLAVIAGYVLAGVAREPLPDYWRLLAASIVLWPAVFAFNGLYGHKRLVAGWQEARQVVNAVTTATFLIIFTSFLLERNDLSRGWIVVAWPSCLATVTAFRAGMRRCVRTLRGRGHMQTPLVIVGTNDEARSMARTIARQPWVGYTPVGFVRVTNGTPVSELEDPGIPIDGLPVLGWTSRISEAVRRAGAPSVLIASTATPSDKLVAIYRDLQEADIEVRISAGILNIAASRMAVEPLDGLPVLSLRRMQLERSQRALKRAFDVVASSLIIVGLAPVLAALALAVKLTSPGPVLFRQRRVGLGERPFMMFKFRSMYTGAESLKEQLSRVNQADGLLFKMRDDPRITPVGRVLRRYSLDELPQLFNVLRGDMSLVGPRPPLPEEVAVYDRWLRGRLRVKPGITGLWQVSGRHELTFEDYVRYDLFYVGNWSLALDLSILWRTIPAVFSGRGSW